MRRKKKQSNKAQGERLQHQSASAQHATPAEGTGGTFKIVPDAVQLEAAVRRSQREPALCVVCGRRQTMNRSVYVPSNSHEAGIGEAPLGRVRVVLYAVCDECRRSVPDYMQVVEAKLRSEGVPYVVDAKAILEREQAAMLSEAGEAAASAATGKAGQKRPKSTRS